MSIRSIAAALVLCAACVEEGSDSDRVEPSPVQPDKAEDPPMITSSLAAEELAPAQEVCDIRPDPDEPQGPCTFACDQEALDDFIPEGFCMTFLCERADGTKVKIGGCNSGD